MLRSSLLRASVVVAAGILLLAPSRAGSVAGIAARVSNTVSAPALLAINGLRNTLEFWPLSPHGGRHPTELAAPAGLSGSEDIAADNDRIAIANSNAGNVVTYDLRTNAEHVFGDVGSYPISIAFGRNHAIYVANFPAAKGGPYTVTEYAPHRAQQTFNCAYLGNPAGIAVDNEGDVFVNVQGSFVGVVELPAGTNQPCAELQLQPETGYAAGLAIDPKTDDLLVLSNPGECAGGDEGLVTIYPKPYNALTGHQLLLGGNCTGGLKLDATSSTAFLLDETVSGGSTYVMQFTYPGGRQLGTYYGGNPGGVTTVPNSLPN